MDLTDEQKADITERESKFIEKYQAIVDELQMDFHSFPLFLPNPNGSFAIVVSAELRDKKYLPVVSPLSN